MNAAFFTRFLSIFYKKAVVWEEWNVMKINQKGKFQRRKMGIGRDGDTYVITNDKMDNSHRLRQVNTAKRDIETVKSVRMASDRETVEIVYKEDGESDYILKYKPYTLDRNKEIKYSNDEAVRIACKILCLKNLRKP